MVPATWPGRFVTPTRDRSTPRRVGDRTVQTELIKPRGPWRTAEQVQLGHPGVRRLVQPPAAL